MPERIQLRRTRGWRKPDGAVIVARPSRWGNPFRLGPDGDRPTVMARFRTALAAGELEYTEDDVRAELAGKDLCCWCPLDEECHGDHLLAIAGGSPGVRPG